MCRIFDNAGLAVYFCVHFGGFNKVKQIVFRVADYKVAVVQTFVDFDGHGCNRRYARVVVKRENVTTVFVFFKRHVKRHRARDVNFCADTCATGKRKQTRLNCRRLVARTVRGALRCADRNARNALVGTRTVKHFVGEQ